MTVKLFQDVAGTIPAVLAGQPVGFIKRTKGSDDAKQATALSKPTYARHPWTGVRNLANGAQAVNAASPWLSTSNGSGVAFSKVATGMGAHGPWVDIQANAAAGFLSGTGASNFFVTSATFQPATPNEVISASLVLEIIDGGLIGSQTIGIVIAFENAAGATIDSRVVQLKVAGVIENLNYIAPADTARVRVTPRLNWQSGEAGAVSVRFRISGLQMMRGQVVTGIQYNYGPNDITEAGVPDLWHLYNDGGDSLNVTLPAGTYGLATIGIDRQIDIGTFVSDGTTPVNILRHERQLDVSYRFGAYSAAEELAIRDAWGRKYA